MLNCYAASWAIEKLNEPELNPNRMEEGEFVALTAAIRAKGFLQPVLVREEDALIIDGVHRVRAAKEVGMLEVPVWVVRAVSDAEVQALRVGMNKMRGQLDLAQVALVFGDLVDAGYPLEELMLTGFSAADVDSLLAAAQQGDSEVMPESIESSPEERETNDKPLFVLEVEFSDRVEYLKARKGLRRAAGKGGELRDGLLKLLGEEGR